MIGDIYVTKSTGERELFDVEKLKDSLRDAGASEQTIESITQEIANNLFEGTSTLEIYDRAFSLLKEKEKVAATRYSVRKAISELGPEGFPFEDYIGEIFRAKGYKVEVGKTVNGKCVLHELDVTAENDTEFIGAELKFHNKTGIKSDLKTVLYVKARFDDLEEGGFYKTFLTGKKHRKMLVTNTKFTTRAIQYANCVGLEIIGWDYPHKNNLRLMIEESGLHPITALQSLTDKEKSLLLNQGIVLCKEIKIGGENFLKSFGVPDVRIPEVLDEVNALCGGIVTGK